MRPNFAELSMMLSAAGASEEEVVQAEKILRLLWETASKNTCLSLSERARMEFDGRVLSSHQVSDWLLERARGGSDEWDEYLTGLNNEET